MRFKHVLRTAFVTLLVATALAAHAQVQLSLWNFNDENFDVDGGVLGGSLVLLGGVTHEWVTGSPLDTASPNRGMNTRNYPAQGTGNRTAGVRFNTPTTGYMNVVVKLDFRWSNTASRYARFQYTVDGVNWIDGPQLVAPGGDTWYSQGYGGPLVVDFTGNSAVSNNPLFAFRVVSEFAPGTNGYVAARPTSSYASTGTYRF
ncbi:MAG: hypothetical protein RMK92_07235 [Armatimonadota bacterium]|nr:hypothetical protein [Armatimonadota bacterium]